MVRIESVHPSVLVGRLDRRALVAVLVATLAITLAMLVAAAWLASTDGAAGELLLAPFRWGPSQPSSIATA